MYTPLTFCILRLNFNDARTFLLRLCWLLINLPHYQGKRVSTPGSCIPQEFHRQDYASPGQRVHRPCLQTNLTDFSLFLKYTTGHRFTNELYGFLQSLGYAFDPHLRLWFFCQLLCLLYIYMNTPCNLVRGSRWFCSQNIYANFQPWLTRHQNVNKRVSSPDLFIFS